MMVIIIIIMGHEFVWETVWGEGREVKDTEG
jgi:hypothetical protein